MIFRLTGLAVILTLILPLAFSVNSEDQNVENKIAEAELVGHKKGHRTTKALAQKGTADKSVTDAILKDDNDNEDKAVKMSEEHKSDETRSDIKATTYEINQINKSFSRSSITVKVGDKIEFLNNDSYFHNVYSLSEAAQFDLGSYPKGESRTITLEKAGEVTARCAIHPQMKIDITVEEK